MARLSAAGAVILGKTNLSRMGEHPLDAVGLRVERRRRPDAQPLGARPQALRSSSGSGVGGGGRTGPLAIGTETDGSVTCPAAVNGIVGLKPTVGLVSRTHIVPISHSQDTAGPMTRSVREAAELLTVIAGSDPVDPATREADAHKRDYAAALDAESLKGKRIGVMRFAAGFGTDAAFETALAILRQQGATLVEIKKFDDSAIGKNELKVLLTELKADLNAYLKDSPAPIAVRTLADLIAFDKAHARQEMTLFGQEHVRGRARRRRVLTIRLTRRRGRPVSARPGQRHRPAAEAARCRRAGRPDHAAGLDDRRGQRRPGLRRRRRRPGSSRGLSAPHRADGIGEGHAGGPQLHRAEVGEALLLSLGYAYEQARGPFPTPKFYRSIEESPEIAPLSEAAALSGQLERSNRRHDCEDKQDSDRAGRFVEPQNSHDHRADGANSAPNSVGGTHWDRARCELEQAHADRDGHEERQGPRHISESVDEAQRSRKTDLENAADNQPEPGHSNPSTGRALHVS